MKEPKETKKQFDFRTVIEETMNHPVCDVSLMESGSEVWLYFSEFEHGFSLVLKRDGTWCLK